MSIIAKEPESKFTPAPEGLFQAVCVDVIERLQQQTPWGLKDKVEIRWQLEATNPDTQEPFEVRAFYTLSLSEKANLRKHLETWRGRKFNAEELKGFDLERLIGANGQIQIIHNISDEGKTYANVQAIIQHNGRVAKIAAHNYIREKDRAKAQGNGAVKEITADDIPF
jgi:hypothetical protein